MVAKSFYRMCAGCILLLVLGLCVCAFAQQDKTVVAQNDASSSAQTLYQQGMADIARNDQTGAFALFTQACSLGQQKACEQTAASYFYGKGVPRDVSRAISISQKECDAGVMTDCSYTGFFYDTGTASPALAIPFYRKGCDGGDPLGCMGLGRSYETGRTVPQDNAKATELFTRACKLGSQVACGRLKNGVLQPFPTAQPAPPTPAPPLKAEQVQSLIDSIHQFRTASLLLRNHAYTAANSILDKDCSNGYMEACRALGDSYENGNGMAKDLPGAQQLYQKACDQGSSTACYNLAKNYENGNGVEVNLVKAKQAYSSACMMNWLPECAKDNDRLHDVQLPSTPAYTPAPVMLMPLAQEGDSAYKAKDYNRASHLFLSACSLGATYTCEKLGGMYERGEGVERNLALALGLYDISCGPGGGIGCPEEARMYEEGIGIAVDLAKAKEIYGWACHGKGLSFPAACDKLKDPKFQ